MVLGLGYRSWSMYKMLLVFFLETHGQKCPGASMLVTEHLEVFCFLSWGHWILDKIFQVDHDHQHHHQHPHHCVFLSHLLGCFFQLSLARVFWDLVWILVSSPLHPQHQRRTIQTCSKTYRTARNSDNQKNKCMQVDDCNTKIVGEWGRWTRKLEHNIV